jgi:hypothetical protein
MPAVALTTPTPIDENLNRTKIVAIAYYSSINPTRVKWYIDNPYNNNIASGNFPTVDGDASSNNGVTITWHDADSNGGLSKNDTIDIYDGTTDIGPGHKFKLTYNSDALEEHTMVIVCYKETI